MLGDIYRYIYRDSADNAILITESKASLTIIQALISGILCNIIVI